MWEPAADGGGSVCVDCGTATRTYQYRVYPPGSPHYARCIGLAWCSDCRVYSGTMVHVPPERVLDDAWRRCRRTAGNARCGARRG
ncbi:hypothetical protein SF23_13945 [Streptomyces sp. MBRL 10]|nr:hypothetical protein SF23_13945 [Streptomyces sp. MBRL 10]